MRGHAANPVFIFLPIKHSEPASDGTFVDPVCGRALMDGTTAGRLLHRGTQHYFCSLACAQQFAADPNEYTP